MRIFPASKYILIVAGVALYAVSAEASSTIPAPKPSALPALAAIAGPVREKHEHVYDEQGIKAKKTELENKGLEVYRTPAGLFATNVGVHSMYVYSVTECMPIRKKMELRLALKHAMAQHRPDGLDGLDVATGAARTAGTLSLFFAF